MQRHPYIFWREHSSVSILEVLLAKARMIGISDMSRFNTRLVQERVSISSLVDINQVIVTFNPREIDAG